ncbi:MAG: 23S rRNA (uridine(2552)-2'-O)-methyltransferase RlmE [Gammaproteobacteria bacterium]|nr:23S rRNA (uridine(2552)-2'-O)-methyltransferase RlmE [Gammaproteobacteria bacterium]
MSRSSSSNRWLQEHLDDSYVKLAKEKGYRSRACFKLLEIQKKDRIFKRGMSIVDLGAAPGGWSQVAAQSVGPEGTLVASDILTMSPLPGVVFVEGDFTEDDVFNALLSAIPSGDVDMVISDMAPNMSGNRSQDQARSMYLAELALDFALTVLKPGGGFLVKVFQGEGIDSYRASMQTAFDKLQTRKPEASRPRSREVYLLGTGFKRR